MTSHEFYFKLKTALLDWAEHHPDIRAVMLVVTPMQQLHIIEKYVDAYHVVVNNAEGSNSRLFNLTKAEYHERRREFSV